MAKILPPAAILVLGAAAFMAGFAAWHEPDPCSALDPNPPVGTVQRCSGDRGPTTLGWTLHGTGAALMAGGLARFGLVARTLFSGPPSLVFLGRPLPTPFTSLGGQVVWVGTCVLTGVAILLEMVVGSMTTFLVGLGLTVLLLGQLAHLQLWTYGHAFAAGFKAPPSAVGQSGPKP